MSTKLTLTLDSRIIKQAKGYAKGRGTSLSKLVENYFTGLSTESEINGLKLTGVVKELAGVLKDADIDDGQEEIIEYLKEKYR